MAKIMIEISDDDYESIKKGMRYKDIIADIMQQIENAEPVLNSSEKPKTGRWEKRDVRGQRVDCCSVCGLSNGTIYEYNYCPNCGAKMQEVNG